tara:strand:- start:388 stop:564 length:177 start_codon:yes stop_codon:yes gene_type:complete
MGEDNKPKNPLDEFWEKLGDKEKKHVRSYRSSKRHIQVEKGDARKNRKPDVKPSGRRG